jgi:hypothetical protein
MIEGPTKREPKKDVCHIYPKKKKELETRTLKRIILKSQFDDDKKREISLKRQKRYEESIMKDSVNLQ